jgi:hypothetical protein
MICDIEINLNYIKNKESFIISVWDCLMNCAVKNSLSEFSKIQEIRTAFNAIVCSYRLCFCYQKEPIDMFIKDDSTLIQDMNRILNLKKSVKNVLKEYFKEPVIINVIGNKPKYLNDVLIRDLCSDVIKLNFKNPKNTKKKYSKQSKQIKSNE